ncbi:MAG: hypothetical protein ACYCVN_14220 [Acidimicrobiales bacterium]
MNRPESMVGPNGKSVDVVSQVMATNRRYLEVARRGQGLSVVLETFAVSRLALT